MDFRQFFLHNCLLSEFFVRLLLNTLCADVRLSLGDVGKLISGTPCTMEPTLCSIILLYFFAATTADRPVKKGSKDSIRKTGPVGSHEMTKLISVDYSFETESVLYDNAAKKAKAPSTRLTGNFSFSTLHHDYHGGMLARFSLTACKTGNCGNVPDVYVSFAQGGNNIQEVLYDSAMFPKEEPRWNFIYAIINAIYTPAQYGQGDEQTVETVYGRCRTHFSRPEDKRFRRRINNCDIKGDSNYTRIQGIQPVYYDQDVSYLQNTKVDADIIVIDAVELLKFRTPFEMKWGFTLESRIHVEITNRTQNYVKRHCNTQEQTAAACAREQFGAVTVGEKLYEKVLLGEKNAKNKFAQMVRSYRKHLFEMGDSHTCEEHSALFAQIVQESRSASEQDWKAVIMEPDNDPILHVLGNVLGALGNSLSLKVAREVLFVESQDFIDDYLFGAAHSTSQDQKWHKQLMHWVSDVKNNDAMYWKVANTIATILRRRCERSASAQNACHRGKVKVVEKFINDVSTCQTETCTLKSLQVLRNIPIYASFELARGFLCSTHSPSVQIAALKLIKAASPTLYDLKLSNVLIKLFRNTCPRPTSTGESQLAIDILVRCVLEQHHVGTMLLRSETMNPDDHEKWQYFYRAVKSSGQQDELKEEFWRQLRNFKAFRPNYAHRALTAESGSEWREIADLVGYKLYSVASTEFRGDVFKRSEFDLRLKNKKQDENLFGFDVQTTGLDSFDMEQIMSADPKAEVRLSFFGHALPSVTVFKGSTELMGIVWNADGQTSKVFEGNVMLRDTTVVLPLLSGLTLQVGSAGAVSLKMLTSSTVSLWNQHLLAGFKSNISVSLGASASLLHHGEVVQRISSNMALVASIGSQAEVNFGHVPFGVCVTMENGDARASFDTVEEITKKPRKKNMRSRSRTYPGITFKLDENTTKKCNLLRNISNMTA